jgi:secondary thiamine-phosphate synthase enzyme
VQSIRVRTERRTQLLDITKDVQAALGSTDGNGADGAAAALVFVPHTTAGVTINEHADPAVARDFEAALERMVGDDWGWQHIEEGEENAPSHVRASLMGPQVLVPLDAGRLALGTWQGIFFCELDGPRDRTVYVTTLA